MRAGAHVCCVPVCVYVIVCVKEFKMLMFSCYTERMKSTKLCILPTCSNMVLITIMLSYAKVRRCNVPKVAYLTILGVCKGNVG